MTDSEYPDADDMRAASTGRAQGAGSARGATRVGALVTWAGALVSLGLVVGMVVWAIQLTLRDVSGVPVIRALEGPMRVAPDDPGGMQAQNQGLSVNRLAEGADAAPVPDRIVLAPPPVDLAELSLASASRPVENTVSVAPDDPDPDADLEPSAEPVSAPSPAEIAAGTQALIERLMSRAEPIAAPAPVLASETADAPVEAEAEAADVTRAVQIIPASVPGVARSVRPTTRPTSVSARSVSATASPASADAVQDIDAATLPEGTRLVQLGAFDSPEIARAEWDRLTRLFPDYFLGRPRVIQEASSGGAVFYRLRASGFDDLAASRRFCSVLMAQNAPCIPVTVR
jgi:hypothetical protein